MAYGFGTGVQAGLGATDYSNYLRGALSGAQMSAQGTAAIGQGIQNALGSIGEGIKKYQENKVLQAEIMGGIEGNIDFLVKKRPEAIASAPPEVQKILARMEEGKGVSLKDSAYLKSWSDSATKQAKLNIDNNAFASAIAFNEDGTAPTGQQAAMRYFAGGGEDKSVLGSLLAFGNNALEVDLLKQKTEGLAREARQSDAFQAGIGAVPETITQTVEEKVPTFLTPDVNISAPTSSLMNVPEQSVENFMRTGKITPQAPAMAIDMARSVENFMRRGKITPQAPAMAIDMVSKQPTATAAAPEAPAIKPVPKNIEPYFAFNAQTGSLVPTRKLEQDTLAVRSELNKLEQEKERINSELKPGSEQADPYAVGAPVGTGPLIGDDIKWRNKRLAEIEQQQETLKNKSIELDNARQYAADFGKQPDKKPSVEETASNVIDRSLRFAEEVNLDPVDKNQWIQMKTVLKDIPRKATDGEKIAAFVKAYGDIAPIDSGVYFKMKQLFDTTPVITDLGGGNQLVTAGGQSFVINRDKDKPVSVREQEYDNIDYYSELLVIASKVGLDVLRANHPPTYDELTKLHIKIMRGKTNALGLPITIEDSLASISKQPANTPPATQLGSNRAEADAILRQ